MRATKRCPRCETEKDLGEFNRRKDGRPQSWCKPCGYARNTEDRLKNPEAAARHKRHWRERYPEKVKELDRRNNIARYGITVEDFDRLLAEQGGVCAVCRQDKPSDRGWHIDHDHGCCSGDKKGCCGKCVRGLLCSRCNTGLGHFKDDPKRLAAAIAYLQLTRTV